VSGDATSSLVTVNASAGSGTFAAALANAFASEIAAGTNATVRQQFGSASAGLQARLNQLARRGPLTATQRANIESEISRLDFLHYNSAPAQVASTASVPGSPSSPKTLRNAGIGVVVGALLGLILAFLRESFDRRLRGSAAIEATLGYRLVGHVRADSLGRAVRPSRGADGRAAGDVEAFRIMRRNVERLAAGHDHRAIVVTSALPEEGKSSVAASLALSAAATGRRTLLIEADLRRPSLARMLGLSPAPGLSELLNGETDATAVIQTVPAQPSAPSRNGGAPSPNGSAGRLAAIASGRPSSRSAELLASARMPEFLADVKRSYDLVLLDAAPLLPVVDTLELLDIADAVVLCVQSGRTTREQAQAARAALGQFPPEAVGIAVTGLRPRDEPAGHGLYAYDYSGAERVEA
jgi:receptor protein-tyrosine kinase